MSVSNATPQSGHENAHSNGKASKRPQTFMFIDSSQPGVNLKPDKAVRSFVMHQARSRRRWSTRKPPICPEETPDTEEAPESAVKSVRRSPKKNQLRLEEISPVSYSVDYDASASERESRGSTSSSSPIISIHSGALTPPRSSHGGRGGTVALRDWFALGALDPFGCLPVPTDSTTSALIDHFVKMFSPRMLPVDLHQSSNIATSQWLSGALQDTSSGKSITYAILCSTALHLHLMGASTLDQVLYYKTLAISEINSNLSKPDTSVADNNIAAVFMLLCMEESMLALSAADPHQSKDDLDWSEKQKLVHLNGLRTMIQQRGGLAALATNRCLQVFLLMHSIAHSITSFHRPYTTLLDGSGNPCTYDTSSLRARPSSRALKPFKDLQLDSNLIDILVDIIIYTNDLATWYCDRRCLLDPLELQKHSSLLMYRLFDWYDREARNRNPLDQCICLASLIFVVRTSHPQDDSYKTMALTAVHRLHETLKKTSVFRWSRAPDLLLWTLTMGGLAATGSTEMEFFSHYCTTAFADTGFHEKPTSEELLDKMKSCLWIGKVLDADARRLWTHIRLVRGEGDEGLMEGFKVLDVERGHDAVGLLTRNRFFSKR
ncbi:hypothetical protein GQ43DRAFT_477206 [Delitschia confertaspora ATCC 74209]|uniref:Transcription factor domain-containing protein n=1 Tax=Delitschia confertaspora ATCC 74209 TaxID=1513339 RepID=A0A9P4MTR5_9PLEO|nr:hypothetical protein GQ43DRAFT_477206 [Delitschia confertaspora ATCC 74209]